MPQVTTLVVILGFALSVSVSLVALGIASVTFGRQQNEVNTGNGTLGIPGPPGPPGLSPNETGALWKITGDYNASRIYQPYETVFYEGSTYISLNNVTGKSPPNNPTYWQLLSSAGLAGINGQPLNPRGEWQPDGTWVKFDWVVYFGSSYVATTNFSDPQSPPASDSRWMLFAEQGERGTLWVGNYTVGSNYSSGDVVLYQGSSFVALKDGVTSLPTTSGYWNPVAFKGTDGKDGVGLDWLSAYDPLTLYTENNLVRYNGAVYIALGETSGGFPPNNTAWDLFVPPGAKGDPGPPGIVNKGNYSSSATYEIRDVVYLDGSSYQAIADTVPANTPPPNSAYWQIFVAAGKDGKDGDGFDYRLDYDVDTLYNPRDVVLFNRTLFIAQVTTTGDTPTLSSNYPWEVFLPAGKQGDQGKSGPGFYWLRTYNASTTYAQNDAVYYDGQSYIALGASTGVLPDANDIYWDLMVKAGGQGPAGQDGTSFVWKNTWNSTITYYFNQVVNYNNVLYIALATNLNAQPDTHPSSWQLFLNKPKDGTNAPVPNYVIDWINGTAYSPWTVVLYNYSSYITVTPTTGEEVPSEGAPWIPIAIGVQGPTGVGTQGPKGDTGETGSGFVFIGNYSLSTAYAKGDAVMYEGALWGALQANSGMPPDTSPSDWSIMLPKAQNGQSLVAMGDWMSNVTYYPLNLVSLNGSSYIAMSTNLDQEPDISPSYWMVNSLKSIVSFGGNTSGDFNFEGTPNQIIVTPVTGGAQLALTQDFSPTSSPTLAGLTITTNPLAVGGGGTGIKTLVGNQLMCSTTSKIGECGVLSVGSVFIGRGSGQLPVVGTILGSDTGVDVSFTNNNFVVYLNQSLTITSSPTFSTVILTSGLPTKYGGTGSQATLTGHKPIVSNAAGAMVEGPALAAGYFLIGKGTTQDPVAGTLTNLDGTVVISMSGNNLVASLKQGVGPTDSPTFAGITLSSSLATIYGGTGSSAVLVGNKFIISQGNKMIEAAALPLGYFYTGNGSNPLVSSTILSSDGTVLVSLTSAGAFNIKLQQSLSTSATPTFAGITLTSTPLSTKSGGTGNSLTLVGNRIIVSTTTGLGEGPSLNSGQFLVSVGSTSPLVAGSITAGANTNVAFSSGVYTISSSASPTYTSLTITGTPLGQDSGGTGTSTCGAAGTLLSATGSCGSQWVTLQGTANQISFSSSGSTTTASLAQDIAIGSKPTFLHLLVGNQTNGTKPSYYSQNVIRGATTVLGAGPTIDFFVDTISTPVMQLYPYNGGNVKIIMGGGLRPDGYYQSSGADGTAAIVKSAGSLLFETYVAPVGGAWGGGDWAVPLQISCSTGMTTIANGLTLTGGASLDTLSVSGAVTAGSTVSITGALTAASTATVSGKFSALRAAAISNVGTAPGSVQQARVLEIFGSTTSSNTWPAMGFYISGLTPPNIVITSAGSDNNYLCFDCDYITGTGYVNTYTGSPAVGFKIQKTSGALTIAHATTTATSTGTAMTMNTDFTLNDAGDLTLANSLTVGSTLSVHGPATLSNSLAVTGPSTLSGATSIGSTLAVTSAATLSNTLKVSGPATLSGGVYFATSGATAALLNYYATTSVSCTGGISTTLYLTIMGTDAKLSWNIINMVAYSSTVASQTTFYCDFSSSNAMFASVISSSQGYGGTGSAWGSFPSVGYYPVSVALTYSHSTSYQFYVSINFPPVSSGAAWQTNGVIAGSLGWNTQTA